MFDPDFDEPPVLPEGDAPPALVMTDEMAAFFRQVVQAWAKLGSITPVPTEAGAQTVKAITTDLTAAIGTCMVQHGMTVTIEAVNAKDTQG